MEFVERDGLHWLNDGSPDAPISFANHEPFALACLREHLPHGGVFVDVGAHLGRYALRLADTARIVYALEPHPHNRHRLNVNLEKNNIDNVTVFPFAADVGWRVAQLHDCEARSSFTNVLTDGSFPVRTAPLDELVSHVSLMKIDVEGHEHRVLQGAKRILTHDRPVLYIEIHPWIDPALTAAELTKHRYTYQNTNRSGEQEYWLCLPQD